MRAGCVAALLEPRDEYGENDDEGQLRGVEEIGRTPEDTGAEGGEARGRGDGGVERGREGGEESRAGKDFRNFGASPDQQHIAEGKS